MARDPVAARSRATKGDEMPPVPADWFPSRDAKADRVLLYVHGGSFIVGPSPRVTALAAGIAHEAGARLYAPRLRLAPEHACPAAVDDVVTSCRWYRGRWPKHEMFAIAETSGAAILLAALQGLRDAGEELPLGVVLLSPWVDLSLQSWSVVHASLMGTCTYSMQHAALMAHLYLQGRPATDPIASPLFGDFTGLPPLLIHADESDMVFDDAARLAARVKETKGPPVQMLVDDVPLWEQMHGARQRRRAIAPILAFMEARSRAARKSSQA